VQDNTGCDAAQKGSIRRAAKLSEGVPVLMEINRMMLETKVKDCSNEIEDCETIIENNQRSIREYRERIEILNDRKRVFKKLLNE
jgi:hypothetical protein